ncbi:hypothetical protein QM012_004371 [Aureobasidium pullulans]|uniref:Arrestin-like N-terminal domain-containing protein n=1 Tax=Aureobasidium pullulans TaxID=5580 RepID=A0ABR0TTA8_AURPU
MSKSKTLVQDQLRIFLDGESHHEGGYSLRHYRPGQKIKGVASYSPSTEIKVHTMTVIFKATLYNEIVESGQANYGSVRTGNQSLFRYEKIILQGPHKVSPKPHEWPFEFELPERIKVPFVADLQPVPPTWNVISAAKVLYSLKLCVNPHRNTNSMQIERDINVWPFEHTELPVPTPETQLLMDAELQRINLMTRRRSSTLSLTQQLSRRRSSTVSAPDPLNLAICIPSSLGAWQKFDIKLVCHNNAITTPDASPSLCLQTCELALKAQVSFTNTRPSLTNNDDPKPPSIPIAKFKLLGKGLQIPTSATPVTVKRDMMLLDMTRGDASILVPNFSIGAFKLEYLLEVSVQLQDSKTGNMVERRAELPLKILPGGLEEDRGEEDPDAPPGFHEAVGPPEYEDEDGVLWAGTMHNSPAYTLTA